MFDLNKKFRVDAYQPASSELDIKEMTNYFRAMVIPYEYISVVSQMSEAEILVPGKTYLRLWGAKGCVEMNAAYEIQKYIPCALAIGDNEGGEVILYCEGKNGFGLYKVGFGNLDINDAKFISTSLTSLLVEGVGVDAFL